jgi:DNA-directed RNA polymerase specialized sigma24 family protein
MFDDQMEISDNLEWMLQSRQVGDYTLVTTLVQEHYAQLNSFCLAILYPKNYHQAGIIAEKVLLEAVEEAGQYLGEMRVLVWLLKITINNYLDWSVGLRSLKPRFVDRRKIGVFSSDEEVDGVIWRAVRGLDEDLRIAFLLKFHQGLTEDEIALVLDVEEEEIVERLKFANQKISEVGESQVLKEAEIIASLKVQWPVEGLSEEEEIRIVHRILSRLRAKERGKHRAVIFGEFILITLAVVVVIGIGWVIRYLIPEPIQPDPIHQTELVNQLVFVSPTPGLTSPPTPFPKHAVLYIANQGETLNELAERFFLIVEILEALNNIPADQELFDGQKVMIGMRDNRLLAPSLVGGTQESISIQSTIVPLDLDSSAEKIRQRLFGSRSYWNTLWANEFVIQYGPPGYIGEPFVKRQQIWIGQPYFSYFLEGDTQGIVAYISITMAGLINYKNLLTGEQVSNAESELVLFSQNLHQQQLPSEFRESFQGEIEVLGIEEIDDREVLVFDWYEVWGVGDGRHRDLRGRYWIDTTYGVIIRRQIFNNDDFNQLVEDSEISAIEYNIDIPDRLFDSSQHYQTYFARDHRGDPISLDDTVPTEFLSHQEERENIPHPLPPEEFDPAQRRLSFQWTSLSAFDPQFGAHIDLFADGYYLGNIEFVDPNKIVCRRSPDGRLIAFTGLAQETLYENVPLRWFSLTDISAVHQALPEIAPSKFAFTPDSRQLAVYGCLRKEEQECGGYILDTETGNIIYDGPIDWDGFWGETSSPIYDWGVDKPSWYGGLGNCTEPP